MHREQGREQIRVTTLEKPRKYEFWFRLSGGHSIAISGIPIYLNNQQRVKPTSKFTQAELSPSEQQIAPGEILDLDKLHRAQGEKETGVLNECDDQKNCIISSAIVRVSPSITQC